MSNHVKNQHYVPQFLLRNFTCADNKNELWAYDKLWKKYSKRSIKNIAAEEFFYDRLPGQKENSFEYLLAKAETDTAPVIKKIIEHKSIDAITVEEKIILSLFIVLQLNRTKSALKNIEESNNDFALWINTIIDTNDIIKDKHQKLFPNESDNKAILFHMLGKTPDFCLCIIDKIWFLMESDNMFYCSDNPIVKRNTVNHSAIRGTLGINSKGIEIYFPLSPSIVLCLFCEKTYEIIRGGNVICSQGDADNINSLQVHYSDRFIFCSKNNFNLVSEMTHNGEL